MTPQIYLTKSVRTGIILTVITGSTLVFLVFFAKHFYSVLVLANVIALQLSFIWTCAELLDGPRGDMPGKEPEGGNFSH